MPLGRIELKVLVTSHDLKQTIKPLHQQGFLYCVADLYIICLWSSHTKSLLLPLPHHHAQTHNWTHRADTPQTRQIQQGEGGMGVLHPFPYKVHTSFKINHYSLTNYQLQIP